MALTMTTIWPIGFLVVAVIDDLWFKKFHNWLFLTLTAIGFVVVMMNSQMSLTQAFGGFAVGGLCMLPLVLVGAIGAGDMKFMMCFGMLMGINAIFEIFIYSLFWGALIGVLQTLFAGNISKLVDNLTMMAFKVKPAKTNKIPYTVAILFGWLTLAQFGGFL